MENPRIPTVILRDARTGAWLHFHDPRAVVVAHSPEEVRPALRRIEELIEHRGWHAAGWIAFEAAPAFDPAFPTRATPGFPLLWFGLYSWPLPAPPPADPGRYRLGTWIPSVTRAEYDAAVAAVKERIAEGRTYQVNYTFRLRAPFAGSARSLFRDMAAAQETGFAAFIDTGTHVVESTARTTHSSIRTRSSASRRRNQSD